MSFDIASLKSAWALAKFLELWALIEPAVKRDEAVISPMHFCPHLVPGTDGSCLTVYL